MVAGLGRTKILAVMLGPSGLGITGLIDQIVAFLAHLGSMSIPFAALRYLSKYRAGQSEKFAALYFEFRSGLIAASVVALSAGIVFAAWKMADPANDLSPYKVSVILGLLSIPAIAIIALERNVLAVCDRSRMAGMMAMVAAIALVGSSYAGIRVAGMRGLYAGNLVVYFGLAAFLMVYVQRRIVPASVERPASRETFSVLRREPGLLKFCTVIHFLTLASPAAYLISRIVMLDQRGATETGLMAAAFGFGVAVRTAMSQANALYLTPLANRPTPTSHRAAAVSHYAQTLTVLFLLGVLPIVLFPGVFLSFLYSPKFVAAGASLGTFMIAEGLLLMAGVYQALLIGFDDLNGYTALTLVANLVTILASLLLIPTLGTIGAALAFVIGNALLLILTLGRLLTFHSIHGLARQTAIFWLGMLLLAALSLWVSRGAMPVLYLRIAVEVAGSIALLPLLSLSEIRQMLTPWKLKAAAGSGG